MSGRPIITAGFILDESFRRFYARFTVSKTVIAILGTCLSCEAFAIVYARYHPTEETRPFSLFFCILMLLTLYSAFELLIVLPPWLSLRSRQRIWLHFSGDQLYPSDPLVKVNIDKNHATVTVDYSRNTIDLKEPRTVTQRRIRATRYYYRNHPPLAGTYSLTEVTEGIWGKSMALLLMGGWSRCPITWGRGGYARKIRVTPAVPIGLARMQEADRRRLRRALDRRGIPVREVHDEGWARRALRAARAKLGKGPS